VFEYEKKQITRLVQELAGPDEPNGMSLRSAVLRYALNAGITIGAALFLPAIGKEIAAETGLSESFVGSVFIAISTSLPELTVSVAALRINAVDLAVGNIFGSNLFNMLILAIDDVAYARGPLLALGSPDHVISAVAATAMTAIAIAGITYRIGRKRLPLAWDSIGIMVIYVAATYVLYARSQ
jgi:cation:H+ antiporter